MFAHFEPLVSSPSLKHYAVRLFSEPIGEIDPETGQPWKEYDSFHVLSVKDGVEGEISGAVALSFSPLPVIRSIGRELGLRIVHFTLWRQGKKRRVEIKL